MTGKASKNKTKKVLETTLGKAPSNPIEKILDLSHLGKPIHTSVYGLKQALKLFETATEEVQNYINNECDIMYECRICRTIFRSLANFILHKRNYCKAKYTCFSHSNYDDDFHQSQGSVINKEEQEAVNELIGEDTISQKCKKKGITPIIDKLIKKQKMTKLSEDTVIEDLTKTINESEKMEQNKNDVILEKIPTCSTAVFQTFLHNDSSSGSSNDGNNYQDKDLMKTEFMEIHGILNNNGAVLGTDGKVCSYQTNKLNKSEIIPEKDLICTECNIKFSTKKTLTYHIKYKHNSTRTVFVCPICKESFANSWCVYRHLYKIHRRTTAQIKRMRDQIHSSTVRRDEEPIKKTKLKKADLDLKINDEDNQWLDNFECDNDLQRCGGCGKKFERRAALHSHSQMCTKRMAVCNTIKGNHAKNKAIDDKLNKINKNIKVTDKLKNVENVLKGAAKRKPKMKRTINLEDKKPTPVIENKVENVVECISSVYSSPIVDSFDNESNSFFETLDTESVFNIIGISAADYKFPRSNSGNSNQSKESKISEVVVEDDSKSSTKERDPLEDSPVHEHNSSKEYDNGLVIEKITNQTESITIDDSYSDSDDVIEISNEPNNDPTEIVEEEDEEIKNFNDDESDDQNSTFKNEVDELNVQTIGRKRKRSLSCNSRTNFIPSKSMNENEENGELDQDDEEAFTEKASPYMEQNSLMCLACTTTYASRYQLLWHMSLHFSWFRFQCSRCNFMSFNKYECVTHAHMHHNIPNHLMESTVLPIANWKTSLMSHEFRLIHSKEFDKIEGTKIQESNQLIEKKPNPIVDYPLNKLTETVPVDNTIKSKSYFNSKSMLNIVNIDENIHNNAFAVKLPEQVYVVNNSEVNFEDEETNTNLPKLEEMTDPLQLEDKDLVSTSSCGAINSDNKKIIKGKKQTKTSPSSSKALTNSNNLRPTRIRTKSIKTIQNDFIYDLNKVIKLDKNSGGGNANKSKKGQCISTSSKTLKEDLKRK